MNKLKRILILGLIAILCFSVIPTTVAYADPQPFSITGSDGNTYTPVKTDIAAGQEGEIHPTVYCLWVPKDVANLTSIFAADHCRTSGGRVHSVSRNERIVNRTGLAGGKFNGGCCFSCALHTVCNQTEFRRRCILCWDRATDLNQDVVDFGDNSVIFSDQFYLNQVFAIPINIFLISGVVTNTQPEFQAKFAVPACRRKYAEYYRTDRRCGNSLYQGER